MAEPVSAETPRHLKRDVQMVIGFVILAAVVSFILAAIGSSFAISLDYVQGHPEAQPGFWDEVLEPWLVIFLLIVAGLAAVRLLTAGDPA